MSERGWQATKSYCINTKEISMKYVLHMDVTNYPVRAGPRVESARAVTGRQCPYSGEGEDFLAPRLFFFYKNGHNSGTKSRKIDVKQ